MPVRFTFVLFCSETNQHTQLRVTLVLRYLHEFILNFSIQKKKAQDINKSTLLVNCFMYKKNIDKMTCMIIEFHCSLSIKELQFGQHLHILCSRCNEKPVAFAANNTNTITLQKLKSSIFKMLQLKRHKHEQQMIWWSFQ